MDFTFTIDEEGAVWLYDGVNPEPFMHQPHWPDGTSWGNGEAKVWAQVLITSLTDETAPLPGNNPSEPTRERPLPVIEVIADTPAVE